MSSKPNFLIRFWQEVQRRKVLKVLAMYAGSAFIIIQVESSLADPLNLPRWVGTLIVIILSAGFPVTAVLAWIFDLTPEGITKTESYDESDGKEILKAPSRRRLKASDIIMVIMAIVIVILAWPKIFGKDAVERLQSSNGTLSVAVMPFKNMTNDTSWNIWQEGIQQRLITSLSGTGELQVRNRESIKTLLDNQGLSQLASLSPALAGNVSDKLAADIYIYGSIQKSGREIGMDAQLIDTKSKEIIKSFEIKGPASDSMIFPMADSIRNRVSNFLIIKKLIKENPELKRYKVPTNSPDALRYFIWGNNACEKGDFASGVTWGLKALEADSTYADAAFMVEHSYASSDSAEQSRRWLVKNYKRSDRMSNIDRLYACWAYAFSFESPEEQIKYMLQLLNIDDQRPDHHYLLGVTYNIAKQYSKAIPEFLKAQEIVYRWGKEYRKELEFTELGTAYRMTGRYSDAKKLFNKAEKIYRGKNYYPYVLWHRAVLSFAEKDSVTANKYISKLLSVYQKNALPEAQIAASLGRLYSRAGIPDKAEEYFHRALDLDPENRNLLSQVADFYINNNRNLTEVSPLMEKAMKLAPTRTDFFGYMDTKGWGLYKDGKLKEAWDIYQRIWNEVPYKIYLIRSHYEEVKKAAGEQGIL